MANYTLNKTELNETTEDKYFWFLEVLPPQAWIGDAFQVGEPYDEIIEDGKLRFTYRTLSKQNGKHYDHGYMTTTKFRESFEGKTII